MLGWTAFLFIVITIHISDWRLFSDIHISQGSVATYLRCDGIFKDDFVENLPQSLAVKELLKSVNIWGSYGQEFSVVCFFDSHSVVKNQYDTVFMVLAMTESTSERAVSVALCASEWLLLLVCISHCCWSLLDCVYRWKVLPHPTCTSACGRQRFRGIRKTWTCMLSTTCTMVRPSSGTRCR